MKFNCCIQNLYILQKVILEIKNIYLFRCRSFYDLRLVKILISYIIGSNFFQYDVSVVGVIDNYNKTW